MFNLGNLLGGAANVAGAMGGLRRPSRGPSVMSSYGQWVAPDDPSAINDPMQAYTPPEVGGIAGPRNLGELAEVPPPPPEAVWRPAPMPEPYRPYEAPEVEQAPPPVDPLADYRKQGEMAGQDMSWMNRAGAISPQFLQGGAMAAQALAPKPAAPQKNAFADYLKANPSAGATIGAAMTGRAAPGGTTLGNLYNRFRG